MYDKIKIKMIESLVDLKSFPSRAVCPFDDET